MLDTIIIVLGIFVIIQNTYILYDLHDYHDALVNKIKELESEDK